jgi:hypothetical protein
VELNVTGGFASMVVGDGAEAQSYLARIPSSVTTGPDGLVWVLDEGQAQNGARGTLYTINPDQAAAGFAIRFVR